MLHYNRFYSGSHLYKTPGTTGIIYSLAE